MNGITQRFARSFVAACLIAALALVAAAPVAAQQTVQLRYMIWDSNQYPAYQKAIEIFMQENPHIKVNIELIPWSNYWTKLNTEAAGGTAPDVFWVYNSPLPQMAEANMLLDQTPLIQRDGVDLSKYNPVLVDNLSYQGKIYAIPKDQDSLGLFYNVEALKAAGYENFPEDLTWSRDPDSEFIRFLQSLTIDAQGRRAYEEGFNPQRIRQYGFVFNPIALNLMTYLMASNGAEILDRETGKALLDTPEAREVMQLVHDLIFKYHVMPNYNAIDAANNGQNLFYAGRAAIYLDGSWMVLPVQQNAAGFTPGIAPVMKGPKGAVNRTNDLGDAIYARTAHPEEAWELVKFLAGPTTQKILAETGTVIPADLAFADLWVEYYKQHGIDASVFVEQLQGRLVGDPVSTKINEFTEIYRRYVSLLFNGAISVDEAIEGIVTETNAMMEP